MSDAQPADNARVSFVGPVPSPEEGAAVVAAIERFISETTSVAAPEPTVSAWHQAALIEGVSAKHRAFPPEPGTGFPLIS